MSEPRRGFFYWYCERCGREFKSPIPDDAAPVYYENPDDPYPGLCDDCARELEEKNILS